MRSIFLAAIFFFFCGILFSNPNNNCHFAGDTTEIETSPLNQISVQPGMFLTPLAPEVNETSGLVFWQGKIWTHNDSGGEPEIYSIDTATGQIVQTIKLLNVKNIDWEDITQDDYYFYVGDVGNNRGTRKDLKILKVAKALIPVNGNVEISDWEKIEFSYADQKVFEKKMNKNDFDCEAISSFGDSLYLFTKNWANQKTRIYAFSKVPGTYVINPKQTFEAGGLITAAAFNPAADQLVLLGYIDFESFMWLFWDFDGTDFFGGNALRINFPELVFVQTEGVCFVNDNDVLISCEESSEFPTLFSVNTDSLKMKATSRLGNFCSSDIVLSGMPPEVSNRLKVDVLQIPGPGFSFELRNQRWVKLVEGRDVKHKDKQKMRILIKTKDLSSGLYFLKISSGQHSIVRKVRVKH